MAKKARKPSLMARVGRRTQNMRTASGQGLEDYHFQMVGNGANALLSTRGKDLVITRTAVGRLKMIGPTPLLNFVEHSAGITDVSLAGANLVLLYDEANSNTNAANGFDVRFTVCNSVSGAAADIPVNVRMVGSFTLSARKWGKGL